MFYLYQILVDFTGFALEVWVGWSSPDLVCLCPISLIRSCMQSQGRRARNARSRNLLVRCSSLYTSGVSLSGVSETEWYTYAGLRTLNTL